MFSLVLLFGACQRAEAGEPPLPGSEFQLSLHKSRLLELPDVGDVTDLRLDGGQLIVAGTCGTARLQLEGLTIVTSARYALPCPPYLTGRIVDMEGDGSLEIARFDEGWVPPIAVLELDGRVRWVQDMPAREDDLLDSDGDGHLEILAGQPNDDEAVLLDELGRVRWTRPWGEPNGVVALDTDGDGTRELLYADGNAVHVCNPAGETLRTLETPRKGFVNTLEETQGVSGMKGARVIIGAYVKGAGQTCWALDARLEFLGTVDCEIRGRVQLERSPPLSLRVLEEKDQAPVAGSSGSRLRVWLLDDAGKSVFEDTLLAGKGALARGRGAHLLLTQSPLRLLVGYGSTLWEYRE